LNYTRTARELTPSTQKR